MERFGRYILIQPIGKGGMGEVHIARRDGAKDISVLKQLRGEHRQNSALLSRFKREAHVLSYLDHPNIARLLDAGVERDVFYLVLEHIDGYTVRSILRAFGRHGHAIPVAASISIALAVLEGLAYAHDLKGPEGEALDLVHRDLSPNNIMVGLDGEVKIIDFGLASASVDEFQTRPGIVLGTYRYASPEQVATGQVDRRSDLYTVGAVLYECLTGLPAVSTQDPAELLDEVLNGHPMPFSQIAPHLPRSLWKAVERALAKDPAERFEDAREFAERLESATTMLEIATPQSLGDMIQEIFRDDDEVDATVQMAIGMISADTASISPPHDDDFPTIQEHREDLGFETRPIEESGTHRLPQPESGSNWAAVLALAALLFGLGVLLYLV